MKRPPRARTCLLLWAAAAWMLPCPADEAPAPPAVEAPAASEKEARERFLASYLAAEKPALKADTVLLLQGLKERESLRILVNLLGDPLPEVRRNACRVMAAAPDPEGFCVKFLMGALFDKELPVRRAAAEALGKAQVKGGAIKGLVAALEKAAAEPGAGEVWVGYLHALHRALVGLTGYHFAEAQGYEDYARRWSEWWRENKAKVEAEDEAYLKEFAARTGEKTERSATGK